MTRTASSARSQTARTSGLTLIDLMCTLAIMAILLGGALPALRDLHASQFLQATAALLETDIQYAKSEALVQGQSVRLSVQALPDGGSCYLVHTGAAHACRCQGGGQAQCAADARLLRLAEQPASSGISLAPLQRSILFDGSKGTVTPTATFAVTDREGRSVRQIVNIVGRVRSCTTTRGLGGLRPC